MKKSNIIIAAFCIVAIGMCYLWEQKVYEKQTYAYYKRTQSAQETSNQVAQMQKQSLQREEVKQVVKENETYKEQEKKKIAYLTFDDGPSEITKEVLEVLRKYNINATFFLIGNQITEDTIPILEELIADGNKIGIHTYTHKGDTIYCSVEAYIEDFMEADKKIKETLGIESKIFRFPWGSANCYLSNLGNDVIKQLEQKGYTYYDWNVSAEDSVGTPSEYSIFHNIEKDFKRFTEPVILMHDSAINKLSAKMLPKIIETIRDAGYQFSTLDKMEQPYQYPRD